MKHSSAEEAICQIVTKHLDVDPSRVLPDASLSEDLGADSLALVQVVLALEEHFDIDIPDDKTNTFRTVRDLLTLVKESGYRIEPA